MKTKIGVGIGRLLAAVWFLVAHSAQAGYSYAEVTVNTSGGGGLSYSIQFEYQYGGEWIGQASSATFTSGGVKTVYSAGHGQAGTPVRMVLVQGSTRGTAFEFGTRIGTSDVFFTGTLTLTGINEGTWTGSATGVTAPPACGYAYSINLKNEGVGAVQYFVGQLSGGIWATEPLGTVPAGGSVNASDSVPEAGDRYAFAIGRMQTGDFVPVFVFAVGDWENTCDDPEPVEVRDNGAPREVPTEPVLEVKPVVKDTQSKTEPSIDFGTGTTSAKDETLQTGFSSVKTAVGGVVTAIENGTTQAEKDGKALAYSSDGTAQGATSAAGGTAFNGNMTPSITGAGAYLSNIVNHFVGAKDRGNAGGGGTWAYAGNTWDLTIPNNDASGTQVQQALAWVRCVTFMALVGALAALFWNEISESVRAVMQVTQMKAPHVATPGAWFAFLAVYVAVTGAILLGFYAGASSVLDGILESGYICGMQIPVEVKWIMGQVDKFVPVDEVLGLGMVFAIGKRVLTVAEGFAMASLKMLPA